MYIWQSGRSFSISFHKIFFLRIPNVLFSLLLSPWLLSTTGWFGSWTNRSPSVHRWYGECSLFRSLLFRYSYIIKIWIGKKNPVFVLGKIDASAIRNAQNTSSSSISNITLEDFFLCSLELHFFLFAFHIFHLARRYFCFFFLFIRFFSSLSFFSVALFSRIVSWQVLFSCKL